MFIIGVTGGIGSGKSTVSRMLSDIADIPVVDADSIARELVEPGKEALTYIAAEFGAEVILNNGALNRKKLGSIVFSDFDARIKLNKIMFPLIRKRVLEYFNAYTTTGRKHIIYDAPLLFESGTDDLVDYTVLVYVPRSTQIKRIMYRNNITKQDAIIRVDAHTNGDELLKHPIDYCIRNTSKFVGLNAMIIDLWKNIQSKRS